MKVCLQDMARFEAVEVVLSQCPRNCYTVN